MRYRPGKLPRVPEKDVQAAVVKLYKAMGCEVYVLSQPRASMQTPGLPDLWVFAPRAGRAFWHESKAADGKPSAAQVVFENRCGSCGVGHVIGGIDAAKQHLRAIGLMANVA
jgi:hypothetical protein